MSDDDEGITAVEAAGGQSVQLQRVQCAVVLTFCKHPEDGAAHVRLDGPRRGELIPSRHISRGEQAGGGKVFFFLTLLVCAGSSQGER